MTLRKFATGGTLIVWLAAGIATSGCVSKGPIDEDAIAGEWIATSESLKSLTDCKFCDVILGPKLHEALQRAQPRFFLHIDGSFEAIDFPLFTRAWSSDEEYELVNGRGTWKIRIGHDDYPKLVLVFPDRREGSLHFLKRPWEPMTAFCNLSDPDLGYILEFEQQGEPMVGEGVQRE